MRVVYSAHLELRLAVREIPRELPARVYEEAEERFHDKATGHRVAVARARLHGKEREVMVAYTTEGDVARLITVVPLHFGEKSRRIKRGRWIPL